MRKWFWPLLLPALVLVFAFAGCGGGAANDGLPKPGELGYSGRADLPEETRGLLLHGAGYDKKEKAHYVIVQALDGTNAGYTVLSDGQMYALKLDPDAFYAGMWEVGVAGAQGPAAYSGAEDFYTRYYQEALRMSDEFGPVPCSFYFEGESLAGLNEARESPGIDINTGEPLDEDE